MREDGRPDGVGVRVRKEEGGPRGRGAVIERGKDGAREARGAVMLEYVPIVGRVGVCKTSCDPIEWRLEGTDRREVGLDTGILDLGMVEDELGVGDAMLGRVTDVTRLLAGV